ncbi:hypothetical protein CH254_04640 [Rhodococcus sp. 06-412-2C]|nr:hypothetical protein CH254_04640 [Rhodococcus sp. 06-412-2C]OZC92339.1 hypothetical protein CH279_25915 [Rhodococcus sp. 06-412-2B]
MIDRLDRASINLLLVLSVTFVLTLGSFSAQSPDAFFILGSLHVIIAAAGCGALAISAILSIWVKRLKRQE